MGDPKNGWFIRENPIKMQNLGVLLFQENSMWPYPMLQSIEAAAWPLRYFFLQAQRRLSSTTSLGEAPWLHGFPSVPSKIEVFQVWSHVAATMMTAGAAVLQSPVLRETAGRFLIGCFFKWGYPQIYGKKGKITI